MSFEKGRHKNAELGVFFHPNRRNSGHCLPPPLTDLVVDGPLPGSRGDLSFLRLQAGVTLELHHVSFEELLQETRLVDGETDVRHCGGRGGGACQR